MQQNLFEHTNFPKTITFTTHVAYIALAVPLLDYTHSWLHLILQEQNFLSSCTPFDFLSPIPPRRHHHVAIKR